MIWWALVAGAVIALIYAVVARKNGEKGGAVIAGFVTLVATIVADCGAVTNSGAVYKPLLVIKPTVELPPATPFTCRVTPVFTVPVTLRARLMELVTRTSVFWPG